ncbi:MAG: hypothetical protein ACK45B_05195 [Limisphaerales bacterium]
MNENLLAEPMTLRDAPGFALAHLHRTGGQTLRHPGAVMLETPCRWLADDVENCRVIVRRRARLMRTAPGLRETLAPGLAEARAKLRAARRKLAGTRARVGLVFQVCGRGDTRAVFVTADGELWKDTGRNVVPIRAVSALRWIRESVLAGRAWRLGPGCGFVRDSLLNPHAGAWAAFLTALCVAWQNRAA